MNSLPHRPGLEGEHIRMQDGRIFVPDNPVIPFIEGDGIGPDIWRASQKVFEAAVEKAYQGRRRIAWLEVYAGEKAQAMFGTWLPEDTVNCFREYLVGIKGPLTTPVGGGIRSLNVALRKDLDLYACQRPVRWLRGVPSPVRNPELVDMVIFRENTEDLYAGIEFEQGSEENVRFLKLLAESFPKEYAKIRFPDSSGIGIKPVSREGTERVVRAAIHYALANQRRSVTLVHKGNIMKYTEGAFRRWGYEMAEREFGDKVYTWLEWDRTNTRSGEEAANQEMAAAEKSGRLVIKDLIADFVFANAISQPRSLDIIATMNLNGDYLSDALAAQIGGLGIAPGGNINFDTGVAVFEATHGTAPKYAGKNVANPGSVILSGEMMFRYMGWPEAADLILCGLENAVAAKTVTNDFYRQMEGATLVNTQEFGDAIIERMSQ